jgi:hypothetical protein
MNWVNYWGNEMQWEPRQFSPIVQRLSNDFSQVPNGVNHHNHILETSAWRGFGIAGLAARVDLKGM